jgi:DNA-3-methyladenine glycosylase I
MRTQAPQRCAWATNVFAEYQAYHDQEWGVPVHDDIRHFEFLVLEGAQAGLSWSIIIKKRDGYRKAFADFRPEKVAGFGEKEIKDLLSDTGIVRNRLKIFSAINTARRFLEVQSKFGTFDSYIWSFVDGKPITNYWKSLSEVPAKTLVSDRLSYDLKKRGFKFVGSTIMYAHLQACGLINDHTTDCFRHSEICSLNV